MCILLQDGICLNVTENNCLIIVLKVMVEKFNKISNDENGGQVN